MSGGYLSIQAWLESKGTVLWGGWWDVTDAHERPKAAAWFQQQIEEYEEWGTERERHDRIVTAGTALNNLAAGEYQYRPGYSTTPYYMGGSSPSTLQPASPNGIVDPGDPQGHLNPEGNQGSGDSEHPGRVAGSAEGDRGLQENGDSSSNGDN